MILIITVLLVLAFVFAIGMQKRDARAKQEEMKELDLLKKARVLDFLPEMQCSDNNYLNPDCYDLIKLQAFVSVNPSDHLFYKSLFGRLNITVMVLDPNLDATDRWPREWHIYDYTGGKYTSYQTFYRPVTLRDPVNMTSYFGWIILGVYG